jgi:tight adherence protein C
MLTPIALVSLAGTFVAVALLSGAVAYALLERQSPARKRLHAAVAAGGRETTAPTAGPRGLAERASPRMERIASFVPKSPAEMNKLRRRLVRAGYHRLTAAVVFSLAELLGPLLLGGLALALLPWPQALMFAAVGGLVGFLAPGVVLGHLIERRREAIGNGLPDVLDLLVVCLEAGCSLDQAITKVTEELSLVYPALGDELKLLTTETRAGKPRLEAFKNLEARTKHDDIRALVAMLVQTDRFGTSISQALKTFSEVIRTKRRQRAEERAAKVSVKMVFPLVLFLFPALYVVTLGAAIVQIVKAFPWGGIP